MKDVDGVAICDFDDFALIDFLCAVYIANCDIEECDCTDEEYVEECFSKHLEY